MNIERHLVFLGLTPEEGKIYLACLEFGQLSVSGISRITKIGRTNCYHHVEKLVKKGFLSVSQRGGSKIFSAENPKILINKEKERMNIAQEILPDLLALSSHNPQKPKMQFFEGKEGIKNIFEKILQFEKSEVVSFSNFTKLTDFFDDTDFLRQHFAQRLQQKIKTRFISPRDAVAEKFVDTFFPKNLDTALLEVFLISPQEFSLDAEITIFAGSIAIFHLHQKNPMGVLIENAELYRTQKAIFDLAWLGATSFITQ